MIRLSTSIKLHNNKKKKNKAKSVRIICTDAVLFDYLLQQLGKL